MPSAFVTNGVDTDGLFSSKLKFELAEHIPRGFFRSGGKRSTSCVSTGTGVHGRCRVGSCPRSSFPRLCVNYSCISCGI